MARRPIQNLGQPDTAGQLSRVGDRLAAVELLVANIASSQALAAARLSEFGLDIGEILDRLASGVVTPTPAPSFTALPTIQTDGTPQVGELLTGVDAPAINLGLATVDRAWLLGSTVLTTSGSITPNAEATYTFRNRIMLAGVALLTTSVDVVVGAATVTPTPAPTFTRAPAITTDGNPSVGGFATFDYGAATAPIGSTRLLRNGADFADATAGGGSIQWAQVGTYKLRSQIGTDGTTQDSAEVVISAAVVSDLTAPVVTWRAPFTPGSNPPSLTVASTDDTIDKETDSVEVTFTNGGSGTPVVKSFALNTLVTNDEDRLIIPELGGLPQGYDFTPKARFTRPGSPAKSSPYGVPNPTHDVLGAPVEPAPVTVWGSAASMKGTGVTTSTDNRTAYIPGGNGAYAPIVSDPARFGDAKVRYAEITPENNAAQMMVGVVDDSFLPVPSYVDANSNSSNYINWRNYFGITYNGTFPDNSEYAIRYENGDAVGVLFEPIFTNGNQTGSYITFFKNGAASKRIQTAIIKARLLASAIDAVSGPSIRFIINTGQTAFRFRPANVSQWG